jgi:UDP-N-acetylmuramate dehydrogenase
MQMKKVSSMGEAARNLLSQSDLPEVRGRYSINAPLGKVGWFRTGGQADILFKPADVEDLQKFLSEVNGNIPVNILGVLSNAIVRDRGVEGVVIRLGREFNVIKELEDYQMYFGSAVLDVNAAEAAADKNISGLEFLCGIPGSIGGALALNAGAYGSEIRDVLVNAEFIDKKGMRQFLTADDMKMSYRHSEIPEGWIAVGATLQGRAGDAEQIKRHMTDIREKRSQTQPIRSQTGGSTFKNPKPEDLAAAGLPEGTKAWQLVDKVGGRGLTIGGAQMSELHANFMINTGTATAADLETLGEEIRHRVREQCNGYNLQWEIVILGRK